MAATATHIYSIKKLTPTLDGNAHQINVKLAAGQYLSGATLGEVTATPGTSALYASGNSDGSQLAKYLLEYDTFVDSSGNHYRSDNGSVGSFGSGAELSAPVYYMGTFMTSDLPAFGSGAGSLDSAGLAAMNGHMVAGTLAAGGVIHIG